MITIECTSFDGSQQRNYWFCQNYKRVLPPEGTWVDLINLVRFPIPIGALSDFAEKVYSGEGFPISLYHGLILDPESVCALITDCEISGPFLRGFITPRFKLGKRVSTYSETAGLPIVFLGKYDDIRDLKTVNDILGFRLDFSPRHALY